MSSAGTVVLARSCSDAGQKAWGSLLVSSKTKAGSLEDGKEDELIELLTRSCASTAYEYDREPVTPAAGDTSDVLLCKTDTYLSKKRELYECAAKDLLSAGAAVAGG